MMKTPAHKQTDPMKRPGQIINDVTLTDYYNRKYAEQVKPKLTFDEWFTQAEGEFDFSGTYTDTFRAVWEAAQENM